MIQSRLCAGIYFVSIIALLIFGNFSIAQASDPGDQFVFGAESLVAPSTSDQWRPSLNGDIVFWSEASDIFFKDLSKGPDEPAHRLIGDDPGGEDNPQINKDGNRVIWTEFSRIYYLDADFANDFTGCGGSLAQCATAILPGQSYAPQYPAISPNGSKVAWQHGSGNSARVHFYDFGVGADQQVVDHGHEQDKPSLDNEWIVWSEKWSPPGGGPQGSAIYAQRIGGELVTVAMDDSQPYLQFGNARVGRNAQDEPVVVYVESLSSSSRNTIKLFNLVSGAVEAPVSVQNKSIQNLYLDGDKLVYQEYVERAVWLKDLSTGVHQEVSHNETLAELNPVVDMDSKYIVWGTSSGPALIYYNRMSETAQSLADRYRPELRFTPDENFEPMPIEQFLQAEGTYLRKRWYAEWPYEPVLNPTIANLASVSTIQDMYVDLLGDSVTAGGGERSHSIDHGYVYDHYAKPYLANRDMPESPFPRTIYARVVSKPAGNENSFIQFWLFYYANDHAEIFHEGDWEVVQIDLDKNLKPFKVNLSQHGYGQWRNWDGPGSVEKSASLPDQPVVYVGLGSHANYFYAHSKHSIYYNGHDLIVAWDDASGGGTELNNPNALCPIFTPIKVLPEVEQVTAGSFEWLKYLGQWGEYTGAKIDIPAWPDIQGKRDGPDNPPVQSYWNHAFAWNDNNCDGCQDDEAQGTDTQITVKSPVDIILFDSEGRRTGKNADGSIDEQIPGSEYLEYPDLHRKSIIVRGSDINQGFRLEATGNGTGPADFIVTAPDHPSGNVDTLNYNSVQVSPSTRITMSLDGSKNYSMAIDADGDGTSEAQKPPDLITPNPVDFTPPGTIMDLTVAGTTSATATLTFTAPGDDGASGNAAAYDLRYSTSPITEENWKDAVPVSGLPDPLMAGSAQTLTVSGLEAGTTYFFALRAMDESALFSPVSVNAAAATTIPSLSWTRLRVYWATWADYESRQLSIDYIMTDPGTAMAIAPTVHASFCNPSSVYVTTPLPWAMEDLDPGTSRTVTLKYFVPTNVGNFTTTTYANCQDDAGRTYWYPGPLS